MYFGGKFGKLFRKLLLHFLEEIISIILFRQMVAFIEMNFISAEKS
jgi:hypothetical protein